MDRRRGAAAREFEDFDPVVEWKLAGEDQDVVEISLPGFRKDQVRVQVDNQGVLRATGERPARGGRWVRFKKDLRLPDNCDADAVRARFEGDKLIVMLPIAVPADGTTASPGTPPPPGPPRWPRAPYSGPPSPPPKPRTSPPFPPPPRRPPGYSESTPPLVPPRAPSYSSERPTPQPPSPTRPPQPPPPPPKPYIQPPRRLPSLPRPPTEPPPPPSPPTPPRRPPNEPPPPRRPPSPPRAPTEMPPPTPPRRPPSPPPAAAPPPTKYDRPRPSPPPPGPSYPDPTPHQPPPPPPPPRVPARTELPAAQARRPSPPPAPPRLPISPEPQRRPPPPPPEPPRAPLYSDPPPPAPAKPTIHDQTEPTTAEPKPPSPSPPPHGTPAAVPRPTMAGRAISLSPSFPAPLPPRQAEEAPEKQLQLHGDTSPAALAPRHEEEARKKPLQNGKVPEEDSRVNKKKGTGPMPMTTTVPAAFLTPAIENDTAKKKAQHEQSKEQGAGSSTEERATAAPAAGSDCKRAVQLLDEMSKRFEEWCKLERGVPPPAFRPSSEQESTTFTNLTTVLREDISRAMQYDLYLAAMHAVNQWRGGAQEQQGFSSDGSMARSKAATAKGESRG